MIDPLYLSLVVGALSNVPFAIVVQPWWPRWLRVLFVYVVCLAAGAVVASAEGKLHVPTNTADAVTLFADMAAVVVASQAVYGGLNKTGLLDALSNATDLRRIPRVGLRSPVVVAGNHLPQTAAPDQPAARPVAAVPGYVRAGDVTPVVVKTDTGYHIGAPDATPSTPADAPADSGTAPVTTP